jgi:hypothetical protein
VEVAEADLSSSSGTEPAEVKNRFAFPPEPEVRGRAAFPAEVRGDERGGGTPSQLPLMTQFLKLNVFKFKKQNYFYSRDMIF